MASSQRDLFAQTQKVMRHLDEQGAAQSTEEQRAAMIQGVAETYRLEGREPDMEEIAAAVDKVLAEEGVKAPEPTKRKIPLHYWVLGTVIAIPLVVPLVRLTEALVALLLRAFI